MITSLFRKSTPLNYTIVIVAVLVFFFLYQIGNAAPVGSMGGYVLTFSILAVHFASLFMANFIVKKNGLSKDSAYTVLFYFAFLLFFPHVLDNLRLTVANFFVLLALRRLVSLHSLKSTKEKIFDASLWIFFATLFHFWCILFIVLVFISVLFHGARDYRNWFLPFIAALAVTSIFLMFGLMFNHDWIAHLLQSTTPDWHINYFDNNFQNAALSIYATVSLFFTASLLLTLTNRPLILHSSFQKMIWALVIGIAVFVLSPGKSSDLLIFTFAPLAAMATAHVEFSQSAWQREIILFGVTIAAVSLFFLQI